MSVRDTEQLLEMVQRRSFDASAERLLRDYFDENRDAFWADALAHHDLL
jgi:hypothetical protein